MLGQYWENVGIIGNMFVTLFWYSVKERLLCTLKEKKKSKENSIA